MKNKHIKTFEDVKNENDTVKSTILVSAFPGCGKSYLTENSGDYTVLDSDSSTFDKSDFPNNYINHIKENIGIADIICISSHEDVRNALIEEGLFYTLFYPNIELKDEYLSRYTERGNEDSFVELLDANWDNWLADVSKQKGCLHIELSDGEFISNYIKL